MQKTYSPRVGDIQRNWYIVDAEGKTLGRLATVIASTLRGKNKPAYAQHMDMGDFVIVINAEKVKVTGNKETQVNYYRHSGYPGGLTTTQLKDMRIRFPDRIIKTAVRGMLPKTTLGEMQYRKLKVYAGSTHPHAAQQPVELPLGE